MGDDRRQSGTQAGANQRGDILADRPRCRRSLDLRYRRCCLSQRPNQEIDEHGDLTDRDGGAGGADTLPPLAHDNGPLRGMPSHPEVSIPSARVIDLHPRRGPPHGSSMDPCSRTCRPPPVQPQRLRVKTSASSPPGRRPGPAPTGRWRREPVARQRLWQARRPRPLDGPDPVPPADRTAAAPRH